MISRLRGTLISKEMERVEVLTRGGVVYEVEVPLTVFEGLPSEGAEVEIRTVFVPREDSATLYGFLDASGQELFTRLLGASGVGPRLAVAMLSTLSPRRLARALADGDIAVLKQVSGIGKKTAERIILELGEKVDDLALPGGEEGAPDGGEDAVAALVSLGYSPVDADRAVRKALDDGASADEPDELVRRALTHV